MLFVLLLATALHPPVGASYEGVAHFPLVGKQYVRLLMTGRQRGQADLSGIITLQCKFTYRLLGENARFSIAFDPILSDKLQRYRCSITDAFYDEVNDSASCCVRVRPLRLSKVVRLRRMYARDVADRV